MFQFVYWLKAFAAVFITNSHYANIWPVSALAIGGHLGNCLFFMLSGFCMYNIRDSFHRWYCKRIIRIYPSLWIVATIDFLMERNHVDSLVGMYHCYIYPTWYHFITSIMLLYIGFYLIRMFQKKTGIGTKWFLLTLAAAFLVSYYTLFDRTYYHIDNVLETWVRWQFFASMLVGALLREKYDAISSKLSNWDIVAFVILFVGYFGAKIFIGRKGNMAQFQILLPIIQVLLVANIATIAIKLEKQGFFARINSKINAIPKFVSGLTLEIYLGQMLILWKFESLPFPVDFVVVTGMILLYAWIVHKCAARISGKLETLLRL